jgi:nicotinate-nucleotide adenylyltransferase
MRAGLFGGTFNPVHIAHLRTAKDVVERFNLDKLYLIPSLIPPHKKSSETVNARFRFEMLKLAVNDDRFIVSDVELNREGPSYTIDTVNNFLRKGFDEIFFILGTDAFLEIDLWRSYKKILKQISFIIMPRPDVIDEVSNLNSYINSKIGKYDYRKEKGCFESKEYKTLYLTDVTQLNISSTLVRNLVKKGDSISHLVGKRVEEYIIKKGLYR